MNVTKKFIPLILFLLLLSGCASSVQLKQPVARETPLAVISNFTPAVHFSKVGDGISANQEFLYFAHGLQINTMLTNTLARELHSLGYEHVTPIYGAANNALAKRGQVRPTRHIISNRLTKINSVYKNSGHQLIPQYRSYLRQLTTGKHVAVIILIIPDSVTMAVNSSKDVYLYGIGLFARDLSLLGYQRITGAYQLFVIDAKSYQVMADTNAHFIKKVKMKIDWAQQSAGVSPHDARLFRQVLSQSFTQSIAKSLAKLGLG